MHWCRQTTHQYTCVSSLYRFNLKCRKTVKPLQEEAPTCVNYVVHLPQESPLDAESEGEGLQSPLIPKDAFMKRLSYLSATFLALSLLALTGCKSINLSMPTSSKSTNVAAPLVEKRETLTATGYAVISVQNSKNPAQQRLMAIRASKLDAFRTLTEQVYGQQLDASSTVADMVMLNDTFRTKVEGVIYGAQLVSITPVGEDTYETTLSLDKEVVQDLRLLFLGQVAVKGR